MIVVLDTNVWLDLLLFGDPRCAVLTRAIEDGIAEAVADEVTRGEWRRVLGYPALGLDDAAIASLQARYDSLARIQPAESLPADSPTLPRCKDPDDQPFLELAARSRAAWLLTRDQALLSLSRRTAGSHRFQIGTPEAFARKALT